MRSTCDVTATDITCCISSSASDYIFALVNPANHYQMCKCQTSASPTLSRERTLRSLGKHCLQLHAPIPPMPFPVLDGYGMSAILSRTEAYNANIKQTWDLLHARSKTRATGKGSKAKTKNKLYT